MQFKNIISMYLLIKLSALFTKCFANANEILGCGGFLKSHADIDFSKVEVKLLSKLGSLKDKTDCSPSNGYYFLPVYDKGEYLLKISPPPGWSFEPEEIEINFDGISDDCSQGKDVNFIFKGFGITGKIDIIGQSNGVKGVNVELRSESGADVRNTITDINGIFSFTPVIPGTYFIKCSRDRWHFIKSEQIVIVKTGNTELPKDSFIVNGFDVQGKMLNDGQSLGNIGFLLLNKKGQKQPINCGNEKEIPKIAFNYENYNNLASCFIVPNTKTGDYTFEAVPPGTYIIIPYFENNKKIHLHIKPERIEINVIKDFVIVEEQFQITGFSASGRVLESQNGKGIKNAKIKINGQELTHTDETGSYTLENIKSGTYTIQVIANEYQFNDLIVQISLANPILPQIVAFAFNVCGKVISEQSYTVAITKQSSTYHTQTSTAPGTGEWCTFLQNGKYLVQVLTSEEDHAVGIQFFPSQQNIEVNSSPVGGITFSQLRATVSGEVICLTDAGSNCLEITITLISLDVNGKPNGQYITSILQSGKNYKFSDVLPGLYEVTVPNTILCWESFKFNINVKESIEVVPSFIHTGYSISVISSHNVKMSYKLRVITQPQQKQHQQQQQQQQSQTNEINLTSGLNEFCVKNSGHYDINVIGCHTYDAKDLPKQFYTGAKNPITITAIKHLNGIQILSLHKHQDSKYELTIVAPDDRGKETQLFANEEINKLNEYYSYRYNFNLKPNEMITVWPKSESMLFKPISKSIIGGNDCVETAFTFYATKGLIIIGYVEPKISEVKITLSFPDNSELENLVVMTDAGGSFKFGPLDEKLNVQLNAYKESYVFSEYDKINNKFNAHKLCEIIADVYDDNGNKLSGVLLSLSGAESYRKNLVTGDDGTIKFHSLSPSQYFLRPMLKEYKFEPTSKIIDIKDGETVEVKLYAQRIAYSIFGLITSLNGEPFHNIIVEAISSSEMENCQLHHQEESTTELNGNYRIRGLQSNCEYIVRVKNIYNNIDVNASVERTIPNEHKLLIEYDDIKNVNIIGISPITFVDVISRITTNNVEYYKSLRIKLYKKGNSDNPIYSQRIESPLNTKNSINPGIMVFFPRIPLDKKLYVIELTTSLSDKNYQYTLPIHTFITNRSSIFIELEFKPEIRLNENELNQNSISALVLVGLVAIAFFRQDLAMELVNFLWTKINHIIIEIVSRSKKVGGLGGGGGGGGSSNSNKNKKYDNSYDENEIEKLAQSINATKKKSVRKVN